MSKRDLYDIASDYAEAKAELRRIDNEIADLELERKKVEAQMERIYQERRDLFSDEIVEYAIDNIFDGSSGPHLTDEDEARVNGKIENDVKDLRYNEGSDPITMAQAEKLEREG